METTNVFEGNVTPITTKPKRTRSHKKVVAPVAVEAVAVPTRTLEQLQGIEFDAMTREELVNVALNQSDELVNGHKQLQEMAQDNQRMSNQIDRFNAKMAYVKQTINHAQTSILLQMGKD